MKQIRQPKTEKQAIVLKYITENPTMPNQTLAKVIFNKEKGLFASIDNVRTNIRIYKNASGVQNATRSFFDKPIHSTQKEGLEKLKAIQSKSVSIPSIKLEKGLYYILSDIHLPLHDERALHAALDYMVNDKRQIKGIILNGDILDQYTVSSFLKRRRDWSVMDEINIGREFLQHLRTIFPTQRIIFKVGNHEQRFLNYILRNAPELATVNEFSLESLLWMEDYMIEFVEVSIIKAGKLNILHGHELGESIMTPVNPARGLFLKTKASALIGHYHQISEHSEGNINGDKIGCWSTGCLCELSPEYRPFAYTKWEHGFAEVNILHDDGTFRVKNYRIINGEVI